MAARFAASGRQRLGNCGWFYGRGEGVRTVARTVNRVAGCARFICRDYETESELRLSVSYGFHRGL